MASWPRVAGPTILVVDADVPALAVTQGILRDAGYHVMKGLTTFIDGSRLLTSLSPDLLIADIRLGVFNGLQLVLQRRRDPAPEASILTSVTADVVLARYARELAVPFLTKPVQRETLLRLVAEVLSSGLVFDRPGKTSAGSVAS